MDHFNCKDIIRNYNNISTFQIGIYIVLLVFDFCYVCRFLHHAHAMEYYCTDSLWVGLITPSNLSGRSLISFFLSKPTIDVTMSDRCLLVLSFGGLLPLSLMSHSRDSLTKLFVRMSTLFGKFKVNCDGGENGGWHNQPCSTSCTSSYLYPPSDR